MGTLSTTTHCTPFPTLLVDTHALWRVFTALKRSQSSFRRKVDSNYNQEFMNFMAMMALINSCYNTYSAAQYKYHIYCSDLADMLVFSIIADTNGPWKY